MEYYEKIERNNRKDIFLAFIGIVFSIILGVILSIEEPVIAVLLTLLFIILVVHIVKVNMKKNRIKMFDDRFTVEGPIVSLEVEYFSIVAVDYKGLMFRTPGLKLILKNGEQLFLPRRLFKNKEELKKFIALLRNYNCHIIFNL